VRMREGEVAHVKLETICEVATPDTQDGKGGLGPVMGAMMGRGWGSKASGQLAVQKRDSYIYQWQPKQAGTWLYQSHLSSMRNFEMGLFGLLIVDPEPEADGLQRAYRGGPTYNVERCWVLDDIDPDWHGSAGPVSSAAAADRERPFAPKYFLINGVPNTEALHDERVAIDAKVGDKILIRLLNASFSLVRVKIEGLQGQIIAVDGKALASAEHPWTKWSPVKPAHPFYLSTGARNDILIDLDAEASGLVAGGDYLVTFEFLDWEKRALRNAGALSPVHVGRAVTRIRVT
jgi:FtsP/CotA-like multicopper oxidase with cupredoxin domain